MKRVGKRVAAFLAALVMMLSLVGNDGAAVLKGVYFTAVNEQLLVLSAETMPFWVNNQLYVCQTAFDGTDLEVRFVRNYSMGLAVLFTARTDLRFDLVNQRIYSKNGSKFEGYAVEKNGYVFFPVDLVCRFFDLKWSICTTDTAPLLRITSASSVLDDQSFVAAATSLMNSRYAEYEKQVNSQTPEPAPDPELDPDPKPKPDPDPEVDLPPVHAVAGQKVYLIVTGASGEMLRETMDALGETPATFLLTVQQMEDGDMIRALLGSGHAVALLAQSRTEEEVRDELLRARDLTWKASCSLMQLVWYEGTADISALLEEQGCVRVSAEIDRRGTALSTQNDCDVLMRIVGRYREDVSIYLGRDDNFLDGLSLLLKDLGEAQYRLSAWRLTA